MKIQQVFVIGMRDELRGPLGEATAAAFPHAVVTPLDQFSQAQARPAHERSVLVLIEPTASLVVGGRTALDAGGLPRWPVVVIAAACPEAGVEWLRREQADPEQLARALTHAVEKYVLNREVMRLRGDLLTVARRVNHDLRSSLNGVMTASEVIKEILVTEKPEDAELIQPVSDSAAEIARLIDQVSFVTKATAAPSALQKLPMDELVWKGLARVEARIRERHAQVTHVENWPMVLGVASWMEMVWTNLLMNALDHSGGRPQVDLGWEETGREQRFWVDDRGPGVPADKRATLFTPFHRLAEANAARGFGLSVAQRLVELQGGRTGFEPREGGGSRFYFTLPKAGA